MTIFQQLLNIYKTHQEHFIFVEYKFWKKFKYLIKFLIYINPNYKSCTIFRKEYKIHKNIVVVGLKWYGKNVKRRTTGFAKEYLLQNKKIKCLYCDKKLSEANITTDHIIPISKGGNNSQVNLVVCCLQCNGERGHMDFMKYLEIKNQKYKEVKNIFI